MKKVVMLLDNPMVSDSRVEREAESLVENGYEVVIYATSENKKVAKEEIRNGYKIIRKLDVIFKSPFRKGYDEYLQQVSNELANTDFHILHCHDYNMLHIGVLVKKINLNIHLIYDAHEYLKGWPVYIESSGLKKLKAFIVWKKALKNERKDIKCVDSMVTITSGIAEMFLKNYSLNITPTVLHNIPKKRPIATDKLYFKSLYHLPVDAKVLIQFGTIYQTDEEIEQLFDVVMQTPDLYLVFMGNRPRFYQIKEGVMEDDTLKHKVFFHDFVTTDEITKYLSCADIGLCHIQLKYVGHKLGFTNRFLEYGLAELPVLSTKQDTCVQYGEQYGNAVFYNSGSKDSLSLAIQEILNNYSHYKEKARIVRTEVSWNKESNKLISHYKLID